MAKSKKSTPIKLQTCKISTSRAVFVDPDLGIKIGGSSKFRRPAATMEKLGKGDKRAIRKALSREGFHQLAKESTELSK